MSLNIYLGLALGFVTTLAVALALNRFGDAMFRRGVARPFFVGRHRLHHRRFLFVVLPAIYVSLAALVLFGFVTVVWSLLWTGLAGTVLIAASCLFLDLALDYSQGSGGWGFLHHELVYLAVPAFAFSEFLKLAI